MTDRNVRLALVQMSYKGLPDKMVDVACQQIEALAAQSTNIVCLQELFHTAYLCQSEDHCHFDFAEAVEGPTVARLQELSRKHAIVIVAPIFERRAPGVYHNTAVVIDADGSIAGIYRKMHIPDDPLYYEKFYFTPGDLGFRPIQTRFAKLGVGICWDQWFPETARLLSLAGAEILLFPTAIGWIHEEKQEYGATQLDAWQTSMRAHAISNGVWLAAPNRVGIEAGIEFWGNSFVCSPNGQIVASAPADAESSFTYDCNLDQIDAVRTHWPFLRDRRIEAYGDLSKRWID